MKEPRFPEEEGEDCLNSETDNDADETDAVEAEVEGEAAEEFSLLESDDDDDFYRDSSSGQRIKRVNARRALEDYFEEKIRREEENYFAEFSIPLDDD